MIGRDREAEILRLYHAEKWCIGTIATQLGVHHSTVRRVLAQAGLDAGRVSLRPSMVDPYVPFIEETLGQYPRLRASRSIPSRRGIANGHGGLTSTRTSTRSAAPAGVTCPACPRGGCRP